MNAISSFKKLTVAFLIAAAASCTTVNVIVKVSSVAIDQKGATLTVGEELQLSATVLPENAEDRTVTWLSSDEGVVMISSDCRAKAISAGSAVIRAEAGEESDEITITVTAAVIPKAPSPSVTVGAERISAVNARLKGKANIESASADITVGFQFAKAPEDLPFNSTAVVAEDVDAGYNYTAVITGLEPGATYYYRSILGKDGEEFYGETKSFQTKDLASLLSALDVPAADIDQQDAMLKAQLNLEDVEYTDLSYGFIWGTAEGALNNTAPASELGAGAFQAALSKLHFNTKYWYKAFVTIDGYTLYSGVKSFTTADFAVNAVDLGLSVKWADRNLKANGTDDTGDYYAWGETEPYYEDGYALARRAPFKDGKSDGYWWTSYKWCKGSDGTLTKYCSAIANQWAGEGEPDNKAVLDPEDDAAHVILGGGWRMPTIDEFHELYTSCTWTWTVVNGLYGYRVSGNGNSLFLPAASSRLDDVFYGYDGAGAYWSSCISADEDQPHRARYLYFDIDNIYDYLWDNHRYLGFSIRAVTE